MGSVPPALKFKMKGFKDHPLENQFNKLENHECHLKNNKIHQILNNMLMYETWVVKALHGVLN